MWGTSYCVQLPNPNPANIKFKEKHWISISGTKKGSWSVSATSKSKSGVISVNQPQTQSCSWVSSTTAAAPPFINQYKPPQLGLLSLLFVLSAAIGAMLSVAIISVPTMMAFRKLAVSADKLSKVVSEEVPGTLSSLKLSGLEINELTQQLSSLRQKVSGIRGDKKRRSNKPTSSTSNIVN
ncbi:hypothetical protein ACOSP7_007844 [Xanthoceras sorbifolium]|uniref:Uncharacterized protein n=1 Tax=Xanthoceras sorbifolium TaxID=99658 RepID=A0ABQ8GZX2_9ROSI|nr:hypothetical protein JRO89_XSUnG0048900 [Xanthoceras sorbifolium]